MTDLSKRQFIKMAAGTTLLGTAGLLRGCKSQPEVTASELKLLNFQFECKGHEDRAASVQSAFASNIQGGDATQLGKLFLQMSKLPDSYLKFIQDCAGQGFHIKIVPQITSYPGAAGLCMGGMNGDTPQWIQLSHQSFGSTHVALHELGHACHSFAGSNPVGSLPDGIGFEDGLQRTFQQTSQNGEGSKMWSYARTNTREFLAVSFSSFYCGEGAQADMRTSFPITYTFFNAVLQPAPAGGAFGSQTTGTTATTTGTTVPNSTTPGTTTSTPPVTPTTPTTTNLPPTGVTGNSTVVADDWKEWEKAMQAVAVLIAQDGLKLTATGSTKGSRESGRIIRPSWQELHAEEILIVEMMPYRIVRPESLRLKLYTGGQPIDLQARFKVDALNKEHLSAEIRLPPASKVFKNAEQTKVPCHLALYDNGTLLAHSEHTFLRLHHDDNVLSPRQAFRHG